jgi:hypothetical protein
MEFFNFKFYLNHILSTFNINNLLDSKNKKLNLFFDELVIFKLYINILFNKNNLYILKLALFFF